MGTLDKGNLNVPTYLVPVLLGLLGVFAAQYVDSSLLRASIILVSLAGALFAGGSLYTRLRGSLWERYTVITGMVLVTLGAVVTVSGFDRPAETPEAPPDRIARISHVAGTGSLILGLTVILVAVLRRGRAISELSQRFSSLAAHSRDGFLLLSPEGQITYANERFAHMCGHGSEELLGLDLDAVAAHLDCAPFGPQAWGARRIAPWEVERAWTLQGEERQFAIAGAPVTNYRGRIVGALLTVRDITEERRLAETLETYTQGLEELVEERTRRLRTSEERLRNLLLHMREGFMTVDRQFRIRFANERLAQMLDASAHELQDQDFSGYVDPAEHGRLLEMFESSMARREAAAPQEFSLKTPSGRLPVVIAAGKAGKETPEAGETLSLVVTDITELKRMQRQLEERAQELETANAELQMLDRAKDSFLSTVTHELRTPLSTMRGYLEMLASGSLGAVAPNQTSAVEVMRRNANRLGALIDELLEFSRMEVRGLTLNRSLVAIEDVAREAAASWRPEYKQRGVRLDIVLPGNAPLVWADRLRVAQVLSTLLSNASKFTPEGGSVSLSYRITRKGAARVAVSDSGIGVSEEHRQRIFDKFYQIDSSLNRRYEGAGIGLSIAKSIAQAHGGAIELDSAEETGATFTLVLPGAAFGPLPEASAESPLAGRRALLVCDDAVLRAQLESLMAAAGAEVAVSRQGGQALRLAAELEPDAVVIDHALPDKKGDEVAAQLARGDGRVPGLLVLTDPSRGERLAGSEVAGRTLARPFSPEQFLDAVAILSRGAYGGETGRDGNPPGALRVLVIDRDADTLEWLEMALSLRGVSCRCARNVEEARPGWAALPSIIFIEAADGNLELIRSEPGLRDIPVVLLTRDDAIGENTGAVVGILKKPFAMADVVARVEALRDRSGS